MTKKNPAYLSGLPTTLLTVLFAALCGYVTYKLLRYHFHLLLFPWPVQYRETANLLSTELLLKGGNPFALENQPVYVNVYGLLYNLFVYPVAAVFGSTLAVHKAVAGFFTLCDCTLVYLVLRRGAVSRTVAWSGALVVYISLLVGKTSLAEPDSLGLLFYLLAISVSVLFNFSTRSLAWSIAAGIAAFYTKAYFVLALPFIGLYLLLFVSPKKGMAYMAVSGGALALSAVAVNAFCETYFYNTYLIHRNVAGSDVAWMKMQWSVFYRHLTELLSAICIAACAAVLAGIRRKRAVAASTDAEAESASPGLKISLPLFSLLLFSVLFTLKLGLHVGAYMTYLFQLAAPLFVLSVFPLLDRDRMWKFAIFPLIGLNLVRTSVTYTDFYEDFLRNDRGNWQKADRYVSDHNNILNSPAIAPLLFAQGKPVYDSGQSQYFQCGLGQPVLFSFLFPPMEDVGAQSFKYKQLVAAGIAQKKFDLLMLDRSFSKWLAPASLISQQYTCREVLTLYMPHMEYRWQVDVWEPKK